MKTDLSEEQRELILLRAAYQILKKTNDGPYVVEALATTTVWDGVVCDGGCLMGEIEELLLGKNINPDYTEEAEF